jgi:chromosome condensin MukBEF ATPase and DNA-binding subunit MukB
VLAKLRQVGKPTRIARISLASPDGKELARLSCLKKRYRKICLSKLADDVG